MSSLEILIDLKSKGQLDKLLTVSLLPKKIYHYIEVFECYESLRSEGLSHIFSVKQTSKIYNTDIRNIKYALKNLTGIIN